MIFRQDSVACWRFLWSRNETFRFGDCSLSNWSWVVRGCSWTKSNLIWGEEESSLCQKKLPQKWPQIDFDRDCSIRKSTTVEGWVVRAKIWVEIRRWGSRSPGGRIIVHIWQRKKPSGRLIDSGQDPCQLTDLQEVGIWLVALPVWLPDEENLSQRTQWGKVIFQNVSQKGLSFELQNLHQKADSDYHNHSSLPNLYIDIFVRRREKK